MAERTQDEIKARYDASTDMFGFDREVLAESMDLTTLAAAGYGVSQLDDWEPTAGAQLEDKARDYLTFAIGKVEDHRGISADRSVTKLREYAWLMGRDDVVAAMDAEDYAQYGAPMLRAFAVALGWPWPESDALSRMAEGLPCSDDCEEGCGR